MLLESDLPAEQSELLSLQSDYDQAKSDLAVLQAKYITATSELDTLREEHEAVSAELSEIKEVYPPRFFSSQEELEDWLRNNDVSEKPQPASTGAKYQRALELQEDALKDGYVIWINYCARATAEITCFALVGDTMLKFAPWTDTVSTSIPKP